jgi:hypothetical protein
MSYGWRTVDRRDVEICDECGFDGRDVRNESADLAEVLGRLAALDDRHDAHRRPSQTSGPPASTSSTRSK